MATYVNNNEKSLYYVHNHGYNVIVDKRPLSVSFVKNRYNREIYENILNENGQYEAIIASCFEDVLSFFEKDGYILLPQKDGRSGSRTLIRKGEIHTHFHAEKMPYSVAIKSDGSATIISGKLDIRIANVKAILATHDAVKLMYYKPPFKEKQRWGHLAVVESFRLENNKIFPSYEVLTESDRVYLY